MRKRRREWEVLWHGLDKTLGVLVQGMDGASLRHKVISNNLANVNTPNFKRQDVDFISQLKSQMTGSITDGTPLALTRTNARHLAGKDAHGQARIVTIKGRVREDRNNINIDAEMAKKAENEIYYNYLASSVINKYKLIANAIKGGER